jgi:hypothetical protein
MTCLQPLLASDNNGTSGNSIKVIVDSFEHKTKDELHGFRDAKAPNRSPAALAKTPRDPAGTRSRWKEGTFDDWATDAFDISFREVYGEGEWARADRIGAGARASANHVRKHLAWCMIRVNIFVR